MMLYVIVTRSHISQKKIEGSGTIILYNRLKFLSKDKRQLLY